MSEVSRQRKRQIKWRAQGRCVNCGQPALPSTRKGSGGFGALCLKHRIASRERQRNPSGQRGTPD
jgi:hypothetical protein